VNKRRFITLAIGSLAVSALAMTVAMLIAAPASAAKSAASRYGVINATVNASTVHEIAGSSAFPNFTTGAIDNYYSMAHSAIDNSPSAEGTSSPADTGPVGQTVAATHFQQPQYADARWPGKDSGKASFGKPGSPYAVATAASYHATAECSEASSSNGASPPGMAAPPGFSRQLNAALAAWKAKWATPLKLNVPSVVKPKKPKVPVPVPTVPTPTVPKPPVSTPTPTVPTLPKGSFTSASSKSSTPSSSGDGGALFESATLATVDPQSGNVLAKGESSLGRVSLGGGQIVIRGIDVLVSVTNNSKPTDKVSVNVGAASIGGVPVTIDQSGVHVKGQGSNLPYPKADDALNGALKKAGVKLHTAAPETKKGPNELTVTATGVHVAFVQPADAPGVPSQFVDHILGEVFVDSLAAPAPPIPSLGFGGGSGSALGGAALGSGSGSLGYSSGGGSSASSGYSSQPASSGNAAQATSTGSLLSSLTHKPVWLLAGYLVWQTLLIGTGISLRRWWMAGTS
jgi:hypothetical protein